MPFLPLPPRTVGAWGRKRFVGEFHTRGGHTALCCRLISSFYIKPQPLSSVSGTTFDCLISSFYIKPQPATLVSRALLYCLISSFYIKPQLIKQLAQTVVYCLISSFYIKPQHFHVLFYFDNDCLISSFYIKPQPVIVQQSRNVIVLYRLSTSNHNSATSDLASLSIVLYRLSTSNHNWLISNLITLLLSYIVFLHQTTTGAWHRLYKFHCLISSFYIKPQQS